MRHARSEGDLQIKGICMYVYIYMCVCMLSFASFALRIQVQGLLLRIKALKSWDSGLKNPKLSTLNP